MQDRQQIRKQIRAKRKELSSEQRQIAADQAANNLFQLEIFQQSQHIACYMAKGSEISTIAIIKKIWEEGKHCYLPIVRNDKVGFLYFMEYLPEDKLEPDCFGILEPIYNAKKCIAAEDLDLVIMPLTAFDFAGNRIGTGGGYYDRTFSFLKNKSGLHKPYLLGLAYSFQKIPKIESAEWDIKMNAVVTDLG